MKSGGRFGIRVRPYRFAERCSTGTVTILSKGPLKLLECWHLHR
jgi:hypothetical protein